MGSSGKRAIDRMVRPEDCSIHPRAVDRHGIHEIGGPLMVGGAHFLSPRTALFRDLDLREMLNSEQRFQAYLQFREQAFRIAATQLVSASNSPVDLFPLTGADGDHSRSALVFGHIMFRDTHHSFVADDQNNGSGVDNKSTICHLPEDEIHHYKNHSIVADDHSNGSGVDNISTICYLPEDEIRHYKNEKDSFLWRLHYARRYFAHRKGLVKLDFIQSNCDPEEALKRLKSSTGWSKLQDDELRRCLETHMDLLKEHEMSKMDAASSKSEYENVALEKINMELGSELDEELSEFDWTLMGLYYSRTKLRNLARECAIQCQAQTTGVFLVEEALPVRGYLKEHMLSASPKVRKLPFMKQTVKQLLEGGMGSLRGITEQFGRGAARGKAWQILAYGTVATVAFVEDRRQG